MNKQLLGLAAMAIGAAAIFGACNDDDEVEVVIDHVTVLPASATIVERI